MAAPPRRTAASPVGVLSLPSEEEFNAATAVVTWQVPLSTVQSWRHHKRHGLNKGLCQAFLLSLCKRHVARFYDTLIVHTQGSSTSTARVPYIVQAVQSQFYPLMTEITPSTASSTTGASDVARFTAPSSSALPRLAVETCVFARPRGSGSGGGGGAQQKNENDSVPGATLFARAVMHEAEDTSRVFVRLVVSIEAISFPQSHV